MSTKLTLRTNRGTLYLARRGWENRLFGVFLHRIDSPDPGEKLHDHPWWFASLILRGGYSEVRSLTRAYAPIQVIRNRWSLRSLRLDECHRIINVEPGTITLVIRGPKVRHWGFYDHLSALAPMRWIYWEELSRTERDLTLES